MNTDRQGRRDAIALLDRANPIDPERVVDSHELTMAHDRVRQMIAATPAASPSTPAGRPRTRLVVGVGVSGAVAAVAVAVAITDGVGHPVQTASAMTIKHAAAALAPASGTIVHFDFTGTSSWTGAPSQTWTQDCWEQEGTANSVVADQAHPGARIGTEIAQIGNQEEIYDPATNTIYESQPQGAPPAAQPVASSSDPSAFTEQIQQQLASGHARVVGPATINAQRVTEIVAPDSTYYVRADGSDDPVELIYRNPTGTDPGSATTLVFHTYQLLPAAGSERLLSLTARHPGARVDISTADFRAALNHRLPHR